jgi:EF-hand domain-containing protein 1
MVATPRTARTNNVLPLLPGYCTNDAFPIGKKSQTLSFGGGLTFKPSLNDSSELPKLDFSILKQLNDPFHRYNMSTRSITHDERDAARESARNTYRPAISPAWLKHDRQVLRFNAYFQEPIHENPKETFRIRSCVILFYLEDGTMMVSEPKIENSGIPQGTFLKRHRVPKPREYGGGFYTFNDLKIGTSINIYSRVFRIVGCDEFTRSFYESSLHEGLPPNEDIPLDSFRAAEVQESQFFSPRSREMKELTEYNKVALGGGRRNEKLEQYLENDRKVLRFQCYWDDATRYGARMYYTLHYYLADDTVEMLECLPRNAGRDPYPTFWRKSQLRKNPYVCPAPGMLEPDPIIYKPEDLIVGQSISVVGREVVLYDCDKFTRDFYRQYLGFEQDSIVIPNPPLVHVKLSPPPPSVFGSDKTA